MKREPVEVRDASGQLVARITRKPHRPPQPARVRGWRAVAQLLVFLAIVKLVAWILVAALALR